MTKDLPANAIQRTMGVREILSADGAVRRRLTVHCDLRQEAVDVAFCAGCASGIDVRPGVGDQAGVVLCQRLDGDAPTPPEPARRTLVHTVMDRDIVCVTAAVGVDSVATLLLQWGASGVPVVDDGGHPIGMVSATDLLRVHPVVDGRAAGDVMTSLVFSVVETTELARAVALMSAGGFHQIPVVLGDGTIGGLLSTRDVAHRVARSAPLPGAIAHYPSGPSTVREERSHAR